MTKKRAFSIILLMLAVIMCFTACSGGDTSEESSAAAQGVSGPSLSKDNKTDVSGAISAFHVKKETEQEQTRPQSNKLVVYFSATGETMNTAKKIAAAAGADFYEIKPKVAYTDGDLNIHDSDSRANKEMDDPSARPELKEDIKYIQEYKTVFIGYPIWWGEAPRIMSTFVETHDLDGKTVIPFCTSLRSDIGDSAKKLSELTGKGNWLEGKRFSGEETAQQVKEWTDSMLKEG